MAKTKKEHTVYIPVNNRHTLGYWVILLFSWDVDYTIENVTDVDGKSYPDDVEGYIICSNPNWFVRRYIQVFSNLVPRRFR